MDTTISREVNYDETLATVFIVKFKKRVYLVIQDEWDGSVLLIRVFKK